jgi:peptide-methionine (R)-S-oxide reductase
MSRMRRELRSFLAAAIAFVILAATSVTGQEAPGPASKPRGDSSPGLDAAQTNGASDRSPQAGEKTKAKPEVEPEYVTKSDAEWRKILTKLQYAVTRHRATEPPFSGKYATGHFRGTFVCVCCGATLFNAQTKFESGTGWPSFYSPANQKAIQTRPDYDGSEPRVEVTCRRCGAHLGHVFDDGPAPTGWRFCINSIAIKNIPPAGESTARQSTGGARSRTAAKPRTAARAKSKPASKSKSNSNSSGPEMTRSNSSEESPASDTAGSSGGSDRPPAAQPPRASDN